MERHGAVRSELQRIGEQIDEDLAQPIAVGSETDVVGCDYVQLNGAVLEYGAHNTYRILDDLACARPGQAKVVMFGVDTCVREDVLDEAHLVFGTCPYALQPVVCNRRERLTQPAH